MKILKLIAENVKSLKAVEITPSGELVEITGKNGAGKTSVLDSIWWALAGTKHIQAVPIRRGADKARVRLDLGELTVERRFTANGSTLIVENAEGARYTSPQGMLDALLGALTFDPLAFVSQEPREQFATLRRLVPLDVDIDRLDDLNRADYDHRTEINREAQTRRAQANGITVLADLPAEPLDTAALTALIAGASKANAEIEQRRARRENVAREIASTRKLANDQRDRAAALRAEADELEAEARKHAVGADAFQARLDEAEPLPALVDTAALTRELQAAQTTNRQIEARARKIALIAEAEALTAQAAGLTTTMEAREAAKAEAITKAAMPVDGLGFDGDRAVTFNGIPFDQASTAEQLRVSVALAMAMNPKLRVIRIKEGSLLDADNVALIAAMARERDYQIWIERVDATGKLGVVIEDGLVAASPDGDAA